MTFSVLALAEHASRLSLLGQGVSSRTLSVPYGTIHAYEAEGSGQFAPIALLHGIGASAAKFAALFPPLRRACRGIFAPELPGHGSSAPPDSPCTPERVYGAASAALDHLAGPVHLFGNSLGGALAIRYALDHPDRVLSLMLVSPAGARMRESEWNSVTSRFAIEGAREARELLDRLYVRPPWFGPVVARDLARRFARPAIRDLLGSVSVSDVPLPEELQKLTMPLLVLWGRAERVLPPSNLDYFRKYLPSHTQFDSPEDFGHCPHLDNPRALARRLVEFMRDVHAGS